VQQQALPSKLTEKIAVSKLRLTMNMEKNHITHVNDGFVFLGAK
jgi:hypothetical protein